MALSNAKERFRAVVCDIPRTARAGDDLDEINRRLRESFLAYGSATPDNRTCLEHVQVGGVSRPDTGRVTGLMTVGSATLLSDVFNTLEDGELPVAVRLALPSPSEAEWQACARMMTMILTALEADPERR
jgi:hypothetical protein